MKIVFKSAFAFAIFFASSISISAQTKKTNTATPKPKVITQKVVVAPAVQGQTVLRTALDSLSYSIGVNVGDNLKNQKLNINVDMLAAALRDVLGGKNALLNSEAAGACIQNYFSKESNKAGAENKKKGDAYLAQNKTKEGIKTTASGLQYKVVNEGAGSKPTETDKVKVHYHGTLIDGTVFDSSVNRGEPAEFGVTQVIKGWVEGLQLMNVGSKFTFYIPSELAYGPQGPPSIGPSQVLVFDVELLDIVK